MSTRRVETPSSDPSLRTLLGSERIAALGTVHAGEPFVSMVPFAIAQENGQLLIHVSTLAAHTKHMLQSPSISLMVMAAPSPSVPEQATPRVSIQGTATPLDKATEDYAVAKNTYLQRFPESAYLFDFTDFSLFAITPTSARWVAGFAQAKTLDGTSFCRVLRSNH